MIPKDKRDIDPQETQEWIESVEDELEEQGFERTRFLLEKLIDYASNRGARLPFNTNTPFVNTIQPHQQPDFKGDRTIERKIKSIVRWNAMAMVVSANTKNPGIGGHISTYASAATLYEIGFNHFFKGSKNKHGPDLVFFQGHASPGIYARAFLEGRLDKKKLQNFRRELSPSCGLSSYPHPWLMPDFWQFATVSMGLGPLMAVYQARFMNYLVDRKLLEKSTRKVWAFLGDGEMDEPEATSGLTLASRERLDNLIFVVNCNLQRLDGPVRGNSRVIQELEGSFRGAGWNVIKVIWGSDFDEYINHKNSHFFLKRVEEIVDGDLLKYVVEGGAYFREHFWGKYPELLKMVENKSDDELEKLTAGGHDPVKVFAAFKEAVETKGKPTVILTRTIKGYGLGDAGEGQNITHQQKKLNQDELLYFKDRFDIPITNQEAKSALFYKPRSNSKEIKYLLNQRKKLGGFVPERRLKGPKITIPDISIFKELLDGTGERKISTTMAYVRLLTLLTKDKSIGKNVVPIIPDEARTFGMDPLFRQLGIYAYSGQLYDPVDSSQFLYYKETKEGQILEEGINEAGAVSSFIAAGTSYSLNGVNMIPFYIYYSMFGFQRIWDFIWAASDMRTKGFLIGGTAGRTTLNGEGLQHQDGHSHLLASTIPNCKSYDPTFAYELAVILREGLKRMHDNQESIFYYITVMNENYKHPKIPADSQKGILKGMYLFKEFRNKGKIKIQLLGCGAILREILGAAEILCKDYNVDSDVWSVTSFNELRRDGMETERKNLLNPGEKPEKSYVQKCLGESDGPIIAASDYIRTYAALIRPNLSKPFYSFGTDGYGRSNSRKKLRKVFDVDTEHIVAYKLSALAKEQLIPSKQAKKEMKKYSIDKDKPIPTEL